MTPLVGTLQSTKVPMWLWNIDGSLMFVVTILIFSAFKWKVRAYFFIYNSKGQLLEIVMPVSKQLEIGCKIRYFKKTCFVYLPPNYLGWNYLWFLLSFVVGVHCCTWWWVQVTIYIKSPKKHSYLHVSVCFTFVALSHVDVKTGIS